MEGGCVLLRSRPGLWHPGESMTFDDIPAGSAVPFAGLEISDDLDEIGRHPDIELPEAGFELFLVSDEKLPAFSAVRHVYEDPDQFISIHLAFVLPVAADHLGLRRDGAEALPD